MAEIQRNPREETVRFTIDDKMCLALQHYFLTDAGYISHEFHPDIHKFTKLLDDYIKKYVVKDDYREYVKDILDPRD